MHEKSISTKVFKILGIYQLQYFIFRSLSAEERAEKRKNDNRERMKQLRANKKANCNNSKDVDFVQHADDPSDMKSSAHSKVSSSSQKPSAQSKVSSSSQELSAHKIIKSNERIEQEIKESEKKKYDALDSDDENFAQQSIDYLPEIDIDRTPKQK